MADKVLLFIPAYRCANQIPRVLGKFTPEHKKIFSEVLVIDNQSPDDTAAQASKAAEEMSARTGIDIKVLRNVENVSLGGTHKVGFNYAIDNGFDYVSILHGDDQGNVADLVKAFESGKHRSLDFYLGARFLPESELVGYSWWRIFGNRVFNIMFSVVVFRRLYDLGSGMNIFSVNALRDRFYLPFPNRLTFNYYLTLYICAYKKRFEYFPHRWAEDDQISNLKLFRAVKEILLLLAKYVYLGKKLFARLPSDRHEYKTETLYASKN